MKWIVIVAVTIVVPVSIRNLERAMRFLDTPQAVVLAIRIQYPLWLLVVLDNFVDVSWIIGLYGAAIAVAGLRKFNRIEDRQ